MAKQKKAGGSVFRARALPKNHRKQKISTRRVFKYFFNFLGDQLYYLGASVERSAKNTWRAVRKGFRGVGRFLGRVFGAVFGFFWRIIASVVLDLTGPFRKLFRGLRSLRVIRRSAKGKGKEYRKMRTREFLRYGWMWNKHVIRRFFNYIIPMAAAGLCVLIVYNMLSLNYALAVNYNGHTVGYVADEQVYDAAQKIIQGRIVYGSNNAWEPDAQLSVAVVNSSELYSQDAMADMLLAASGTQIAEAKGLYVGGIFYGATTAGDMLEKTVESVIQPYRDAVTDENTQVRFTREVALKDGIYPESSILPFEEIESIVTSSEESDIYYTVEGAESAAEIANINGITLDRLIELNPDANLEEGGLYAGQQLLVAVGDKLLSVKTVRREVTTETIDYEVQTIPDARFPVGYTRDIVSGKDGQKQVTVEIEYEEGIEISRRVVEELILEGPVNRRIITGTKQVAIPEGGSGFRWPTGEPYMISRGFTSYHMAIDIAGQIGLGIFAADSGVVITSEVLGGGYGQYIVIDHGNGVETLYAHNSQLLVTVGQVVSRGDLIALMGSTGNSTGPHCHFEVRIEGQRVPPEPYLGLTYSGG